MRGSKRGSGKGEPKRRRSRGSGSVYQLHRPACTRPGRGCTCIWWIAYKGPDGRRVAESSGSKRKGDADRMLQKRVGARENNLPVIPKAEQLTFGEAAMAWLAAFRNQPRNKSLKDVTRRTRKHLMPFFGTRRLASITRDDAVAYQEHRQREGIRRRDGTRRADVSNSEINRELQCLKRIFNYMAEGGRIGIVPHIPMLAEPPARSGFFERDQLASVLAHLPAEIQPVIRFAALTGWRIASEVLKLEWRQIDFRAGEVRLDAGTTKNGEARLFPFTSELRSVLEEQRAQHDGLKREGRLVPHVFFRMVAVGRGGPKEPQPIVAFGKAWKRACKAAGCPGRIPHDLRRTAVRALVRAGVPERVAMQMTGHKTRSVFERYNIVSDGDLRNAARRLDAVDEKNVAMALNQT